MRGLPPAAALVAAAHAGCRSPGPDEEASLSFGARPPAVDARFAAGVTRTVLDNGLTVLTREMHEAPVVTAMIWYRIGSADETDGDTGIAHFLEHMMFKGTDRFPKSEIDLVTQRNGGRNNAFTSKDGTAYFFDFASDRWEVALDIEASRMRNCLLDEKEFQSEREVVIEELQRGLDTPWQRLEQEVERRVFPGHAYGHPVIGLRKDLDALTRDRMASYYGRYYTSNNAVLVLTGDFETARALARVRERFGAIPRGPALARRAAAPAAPVSERTAEIQSTHNLDRLMIAWRAALFRAPDDAALDVVSTLLGEGKSSRLYRRLVETDRLVSDIGCWADTRRVSGVFSVTAELLPGKGFAEVEQTVQEELTRLVREPIPERELEKARNILTAQFVFSKETAHGVAAAIGQFEILGGCDYVDAYLDKVRRVTAGDVQAAARNYLQDDGRVVGRSKAAPKQSGEGGSASSPHASGRGRTAWRTGGPCASDAGGARGPGGCSGSPPFAPGESRDGSGRVGGPAIASIVKESGFAGDKPAAPVAANFKLPPVRREVLPNGLTVLTLRRPGTPVFALRAFADAGPLVEPEAKAGIARIVGELLREGTASRSGPEMAEAIAFVGGSLDSSPDGLYGRVLAKDADLLVELAADALRNPAFPEEAFARVREQTLSEIAGEDDQPAIVARNLFRERIYGNHPYHRPVLGYRRTVGGLTRDDAVRHHAAFYRPRNTVIAAVGDEAPEALADRVRRRFGDWKDAGAAAKPALPPVARQGAPAEEEKPVESAQAHCFVGHLGVRRNDPDYPALLVMDNVLGLGAGFTDRLSKRIRDELGLAYEVYATITRTASVEPGTFQVYVGTSHDKKGEALRNVRDLLARFVAEGPTDAEVTEARAYLLGSYVFDYETAAALADYLVAVERFGLGLDYLQAYPAQIAAVTREEVARAAKKHLDPAHLTTVVVGKPPAERKE